MQTRYSVYLDLPSGALFILSRAGRAFVTRRAAIYAGERERLRHRCAAWLVTIKGGAVSTITAL